MTLINVDNIKVYYKSNNSTLLFLNKQDDVAKAVDGVSFSIDKGEIVSLVGESGCGKTTLGKAIMQLVDIKEGSIQFKGKSINDMGGKELRQFRQSVGMIFQDPYESLNSRMNILEIVAEPLKINKLITNEKEKINLVSEALERAGLKPAGNYLFKYPHELSGGQRQRVAIAATLILKPSFIIADEPVSMLDASIRADILKVMAKQRDELGISYLFITHDLSLAWLISDKIIVMYLGKVVEMGDHTLITGAARHPYTKALISVMPKINRDENEERMLLQGDPPNPKNVPSGCGFHPRCPFATEKCKQETPQLRPVDAHQFVACHYAEGVKEAIS